MGRGGGAPPKDPLRDPRGVKTESPQAAFRVDFGPRAALVLVFRVFLGFGRVRWFRFIFPFVRRLLLVDPGNKVTNLRCKPAEFK